MSDDVSIADKQAAASSDVLKAILGRASATKLVEPGPSTAELGQILLAGASAPDHGRLRPWQFIVVSGEARERLGRVLANALRARDPSAPEGLLKREQDKPLRAPLIIVAAASIRSENCRIPAVEQVIAVGVAVENMILAAQALGYGSMWRTGEPAYDGLVKTELGLKETDQIVAFLYLGTTEATFGPRRPNLEEAVWYW